MQILNGVLIALACGAASGEMTAPPGPLKDQFGATASLADRAGEIQLVVVVSAKRLRRIRPWEEAIRSEFESVPLLRVADVPKSSPADYEDVAAKLRRRLPEDVNVLIDLDGSWASRFELDVNYPSLLLFDAEGNLISRYSGMFKPALFEPLRVQLEELLEGQPP